MSFGFTDGFAIQNVSFLRPTQASAQPSGILWHISGVDGNWPDFDGVVRRRGAQDGRKLPEVLHRRDEERRCSFGLQKLFFPPGNQGFHDPGRWFCQQRWDRVHVHLWTHVRRREFHYEARFSRHFVHGQLWQRHKRLPIFHHLRKVWFLGQKTRSVWSHYRRIIGHEKSWKRTHGSQQQTKDLSYYIAVWTNVINTETVLCLWYFFRILVAMSRKNPKKNYL